MKERFCAMAKTTDEQYNDTCKGEFQDIKDLIKELHDKLFVGNGQPPITVQIDRLNIFKRVSIWFIGACTLVSVGLVIKTIYSHLFP